MSDLDPLLKEVLRRRDPPPGFATRVADRLAAERTPSLFDRWRASLASPAFRWAAAVVLLISLAAGGIGARAVQRRREGLEAKRQLMLALGIASRELRTAEQAARNVSWPQSFPVKEHP